MIKHTVLFIVSLTSLLFFLTFCQEKNEDGIPIIPKYQLVSILTEIQLLESYGSLPSAKQPFVRDSLNQYYEGIFKKYEVTREDFYFSMKEYGKNPVIMSEIYDLVLEELRAKETEYSSVDITQSTPIIAFSIQQICDIIYHTPLADELLHSKDTIDLAIFRDSLFTYIDQNDSILNSYGVNVESFKYSFIINTTESILFEQLKAQLRAIDEKENQLNP